MPGRAMTRRDVPLLLLTSSLLLLTTCSPQPTTETPATPPAPRKNVLLITLDTFRADHLGSLGHPARPTPHLDALAAEGVLFEQAIAPMPQTLPSHATLMTGLEPRQHGTLHNLYRLSSSQVTLATRLAEAGYSTASFIGATVLNEVKGIQQGFEVFTDLDLSEDDSWAERPGDEVTDDALAWADGHETEQ